MLMIGRLIDFFKNTEFHMVIGSAGGIHKLNVLYKVNVNIVT